MQESTINNEPTPHHHALHNIPLLSQDECASLRKQLFDLRDHWEQRHEQVPFFTLGTASYLDANGGRFKDYVAKKDKTDPAFTDKPWLLDDDWQTSTIRSSSKSSMWAAWGIAVFWNAISSITPFLAYEEIIEKQNIGIAEIMQPFAIQNDGFRQAGEAVAGFQIFVQLLVVFHEQEAAV